MKLPLVSKGQFSIEYFIITSFFLLLTGLAISIASQYHISRKYIYFEPSFIKDFSFLQNDTFLILIKNDYYTNIEINEIILEYQGKIYRASQFDNDCLNQSLQYTHNCTFSFILPYSRSFRIIVTVKWRDIYSNESFCSTGMLIQS